MGQFKNRRLICVHVQRRSICDKVLLLISIPIYRFVNDLGQYQGRVVVKGHRVLSCRWCVWSLEDVATRLNVRVAQHLRPQARAAF